MQLTKQQAVYLATSDFELIRRCMSNGITPIQFRMIQYFNSCAAHGIKELNLLDAADWLQIDVTKFYDNFRILELRGILKGFSLINIGDVA